MTKITLQQVIAGDTPAAAPTDPRANVPEWMKKAQGPEGFGRSVERGAGMGWLDEAEALAQAVSGRFTRPLLYNEQPMDFWDAYQKSKDYQAYSREQYHTEHPYLATAGEILGSVASVRGPGTVGAPVTATEAGTAAAAAPTATTLGQQMAQGAKAGATVGAIQGSGEGDGLAGRAASGATGAAGGAVLGAALPPVFKALPQVWGAVAKLARGGAEVAGDAVTTARDMVLKALQRDGVPLEQAQGALSRFEASGKPGNLTDVGGENTKRLLRDVSSMPGQTAEATQQSMTARQVDQPARVMSNVRQAVAPDVPGTYHENIAGLEQLRQTNAQPLYDRAFAAGPVHDDHIALMLRQPELRQGLREGLAMVRREAAARHQPINWADYAITGFNESGDPIIGQVPNMRLLDAAKRGLDQMVEQYRDPTTGVLRLDPAGRSINELRAAFVRRLDQLNPQYAAARAEWAGPTEARDAMTQGRNIYNRDAEYTADQIARLSPNDRMFYRLGVVRAIQDKVDAARGTIRPSDVVKQFFGSDQMRNKIRAAFPDDQSFVRFRNLMDQEAAMHDTLTKGIAGSRTASVEAGQEDATRQSVGGKFLENLLSLKLGKLPGIAAEYLRKRGISPDVQQQLSDILLATGPADTQRVMTGLQGQRAAQLREGIDMDQVNQLLGLTTHLGAREAGKAAGSRTLWGNEPFTR